MHQECRCWESIEKSYGWSWAWQKLLNLEPWDHQMLQCVMGKYSSWFWRYQILSERETEAIGANSSMEIFPAVIPLTSCQICFGGTTAGCVYKQHLFLLDCWDQGSTAGGRGGWVPTPLALYACDVPEKVFRGGQKVKYSSILLPSSFYTVRFWLSAAENWQMFGWSIGSSEGPVDFWGLELGLWWSTCH